MNTGSEGNAALRRGVYAILIAVGLGITLGRILAVDSVDRFALDEQRRNAIPQELDRRAEQWRAAGLNDRQIAKKRRETEKKLYEQADSSRPFLSGNDRSRWCTVRALVEPEMRIEGAPYAIDRVIQERNWDTIDMVRNPKTGHLYSSKPPLFPTLVAGEYWLVYHVSKWSCGTPWTLGDQPYLVGRILLVTTNLLPLGVLFWMLALLIERFGKSDWGRIFAMAAAVFGTFLPTFATVLNNHLPAAVCAAIFFQAAVRIWFDGERRLRYFALAGLFSALMVANELPALAMAAALALVIVWKAPKQAILASAPAALLVGAAFFGTNYIAHKTIEPPYAHRTSGDLWYNYSYERGGRIIQSYWQAPVGVDRGEPSCGAYALHALVGHHGIFSLTPMWLLACVGLGMWLARGDDPQLRLLAALIAAVSLVVIGFYLAEPLVNRNYGGMTSGLRWVFWLAPFWLVAMTPALDAASWRGWSRFAAMVLLGLSAMSAAYPTWNPWTHPWLMNYMAYWGWL